MTTLPFSTASDDELTALLSEYAIGLTFKEARTIASLLGRDPTLTEAIIWGIQGSEHCSYKSSKRFLKSLPTESSHVILGPIEDSGIVAITDGPKGKRWGIAIGHESHNHPSQIVPYEGAATGIGGVVRDVVCMGARVVGCMDMLRFGDLKTKESRTIAREVIRGIGGYGNPLGIPNLGGDTAFDSCYNSNCLVNAVALGIVREDEIVHSTTPEEAAQEHYDILIVGKPTDRSGFGGAAFASLSMEEEEKEKNTGAVQEPNPFLERHLLASMYALFDELARERTLGKISCKDLGAGGIVCATVEQVSDRGFGAEVSLDAVHVSLGDLPAEVIACAETQERFSFTCHPSLTERILTHFNETWDLPSVAENARASIVGTVTEGGVYRLTFKGETVCEAKAQDITCGLLYDRETKAPRAQSKEPDITCSDSTVRVGGKDQSLESIFRTMLSSPNGASKYVAYLHYDKNIIGNTILEPGEADAGVIAPLQDLGSYVHNGEHPGWDDLSDEDLWRGVAVAGDGNGLYGRISPYHQGLNATLEAMRNVVAVGATPRALTDCLNYGNPEVPEQLYALEEGVRGIADAASGVQFDGEPVAVISGNVSLYNGTSDGGAIDPTAIVSVVGVLPDARKAVSMQLKKPDSTIVLLGERMDECGGSLYYETLGHLGSTVPDPNPKEHAQMMRVVLDAIARGDVLACHDIAGGGLLMALFEMTLPQRKQGGSIGFIVDLDSLESDLRTDTLLFTETGGFLLEVPESAAEEIQKSASAKGIGAFRIGSTTARPESFVKRRDEMVVTAKLEDWRAVWASGLENAL